MRISLLLLFSLPLVLAGCASMAARTGNTAAVRLYLDHGGTATPEMMSQAVQGSNVDIVELLVQHGGDPSRPELLVKAAEVNASPEMVTYLLDHGARATPEAKKAASPELKGLLASHKTKPWKPAPAPKPVAVAVQAPAPAAPASVAAAPVSTPAPAPAPVVFHSDVDKPREKGRPRPNDFALVIGIESYQSLPKAEYGERDAEAARRHFAALGVPERNIVSLQGSSATESKLKSYLQEWLPLNVKDDSTLYVFYSGHGAPDPANGDAYLVPWDGDPQFLKSTAYPLGQFYADLGKTKARRVVVALDACFSGAGGRSVLAKGARPLVSAIKQSAPDEGRITVLAAASGDQITGALDEQGHGLFTYFLLKGLSENKTSAKELFDYLKPRVQDEARRQNREQTPALLGGDTSL